MNSASATAVAAATCVCLAGPVGADGVDQMYNYREAFIDELIIVGDVTVPGWGTFALFEMPEMKMWFYVPQDVAYVMIEETNPIISQSIPYGGTWVSYAAQHEERWDDCPSGPLKDHLDVDRWVWGDIVWRYTGLENGWQLYFALDLGHCGAPVEPWAFNNFP